MSGTLQDLLFQSLAGVAPYQWQQEAFRRLIASDIPDRIKAPTAAGKSMILATFVAALATQAASGKISLPRRLVFVVNRRVLVDDATRLCESIRHIVLSDAIPDLTGALSQISAFHNPLAISTLRGQFADNGEWSADPSTPAIILATPDMLGSRLLFRGYGGLGRNRGPMHAGFLGIDTLVVHDEAHLAPAFTTLLRDIERRSAQQAAQLGRPPLKVIEMTATLPPGELPGRRPLECNPSADDRLKQRMSARKYVCIQPVASATERQTCIIDIVRQRSQQQQAIAIFVASPVEASKLESAICSGKRPVLPPNRVAVLTGTMRGAEREELLQQDAWKRLAANRGTDQTKTAVLIATGAGEIGIDLDADLLLCDDATIDRQIQRFGRCNRRGLGTGEILVFADAKQSDKSASDVRRTLSTRLLQQLPAENPGFDASPLALSKLIDHPDYLCAIDPPPITRELEEGILDLYACTSCHANELNYPDPAIWIHGLVREAPEIHLVWRQLPQNSATHEDWLTQWPLHRSEQITLPLSKATERLIATLSARAPCLRFDVSGAPIPLHWRHMPNGGLIIFDCDAGGLTAKGLPDEAIAQPVSDVSARQFGPGAEIATHQITFDEALGIWECTGMQAATLPELIARLHPQSQCAWQELNGSTLSVWLRPVNEMADDGDELLTNQERQLEEHLGLAAKAAYRIATALDLPDDVAATLVRASHTHDLGKNRVWWQNAIGNFNMARPLGKSGKAFFNITANQGYRHELGSLDDIEDSAPLVQELIAAHHGYNRPTVRPAALVHAGCTEAARTAARNFADLSNQFGHWGLAYLESLLKCADVQAEVKAQDLIADVLPQTVPLSSPVKATTEVVTHIPFDPANVGEYLAALGLLWLLSRRHPGVCLGWAERACTYHGINDATVIEILSELANAKGQIDESRAPAMAKSEDAGSSKYPPLILTIGNHDVPLNAWCNERFSDKSSWKFAAGRSDALQTLNGMLAQCADSISTLHKSAEILAVAATKGLTAKTGNQDAQRFRYDAATSWTALDVGWSPYEEKMSFSRPWIEILAALGIQTAFPPPARREATYFTWSEAHPLLLARVAARGLTPDRLKGYAPQFKSSGQNLDTYPSNMTENLGASPCPHLLIV